MYKKAVRPCIAQSYSFYDDVQLVTVFYFTNRFNTSTPIKPQTAITVSTAHQVRTVCLTVKPKNSLKSQKPGSFGGEKITLPAPTANTMSSGLTPVNGINGATIPPAVNAATVAEPTAIRITDAIIQAKSNGDRFAPITSSPM